MKKLIKLSVIALATCSAFYGTNVLAANNNPTLHSNPAEIAAKDSSALPVANAGKDQTMLKINGWPGTMNFLDGSLSKNAVSYHWEIIHSTVPMELTSGGNGSKKMGRSVEGKTVYADVADGIKDPRIPQQNEAIFELTVTNKDGKKSSSRVKMIFIAPTANIKGSRVIAKGEPLNLSFESNITGNVKYIWEIYAKDVDHSLVQYVSKTPDFAFDTATLPVGEYELIAVIKRGGGKDYVQAKKIEKIIIL